LSHDGRRPQFEISDEAQAEPDVDDQEPHAEHEQKSNEGILVAGEHG
jgi:hypothetical protein